MAWRWVRWLLPSPTPRLEDQVSVWSIPKRDAATFFRIVAALWLVGLGRIGYNAIEQADALLTGWEGVFDLALVVWGEFGPVAVGAAATAMLLTRPVNMMGEVAMTLYQAMVNRYVFPVIERHKAEGRAEGMVEGRAEGMVEGRAEGIVEGRAQGIVEGMEQGRVDGERALLERQLLHRFGPLSAEVAARVDAATAADIEIWAEKVLDADTLEDVFNSGL